MNQENNNQKQNQTEQKIKKMQTGAMDSEKCKEFAQKLVQYITNNGKQN